MVDGLKTITRREITVVEYDGKIAATTENNPIIIDDENITSFICSPAESQQIAGCQYFKAMDGTVAEYVVVIKGEDEESYRIGKIAAFHLQSLLVAYKERFDRDNFIKSLLLDNMLLIDIYSRAKKLKIENDVRRVVYLIEVNSNKELNAIEIVKNIFPFKTRDFVTAFDEKTIIVIKELENETEEEIEELAASICDTVQIETMNNVYIAIGKVTKDLKNVSNSYKEAKMALEVGKIFDPEKNIINYHKLGIGRLIYQLPPSLCQMFVSEVLRGFDISQLDEETLNTISKFFEYSLNVSETARQLYIHRNTLVYRLDKIQKMTGLDLRSFDDAITFKITLMVNAYMAYKEAFPFAR
jgi:carbohydrate diacid regulator